MSPQQARGDRPRATDDLYALGATLFELLTGRTPFFAGDINYQRQHVPPPTILDRRRELHLSESPIPENWEITIQRLLAKYPEHRPQSAREVAEALSSRGAALIASVPATSKSGTKPGQSSVSPAARPSPAASAANFLLGKTTRPPASATHVPSTVAGPAIPGLPPMPNVAATALSQLPPPGVLPEPGQRLVAPPPPSRQKTWVKVCLWVGAALLFFFIIAAAFALGFYFLGSG
jgi:serine/threonine protein kinase